MRVAIAGAGDLAKYISEELVLAKHKVVLLTRSPKPWFEQRGAIVRITDYSVSSLTEQLHDCEGLVSAILDYSVASVDVHLALLEACKQSRSCKRYIPSEYGGNLDDYPDQPMFYVDNHVPVRTALAQQQEVSWTLLNCAWLSEYCIPAHKRYIKDIGEFHPIDLKAKSIRIPGTGDEPVGFTAARDVAKAIAQLFATSTAWERTTYVCGETTTWNRLAEKLLASGLVRDVSHRSLATIVGQIEAAKSEDDVISAKYEIWSVSGAGLLPAGKVMSQKEKFFSAVHFRSIDEFLREGYQDNDAIV